MKMKKRLAFLIVFSLLFLVFLMSSERLARTMHITAFGRSADMDVSCYYKASNERSFPTFNPAKGKIFRVCVYCKFEIAPRSYARLYIAFVRQLRSCTH